MSRHDGSAVSRRQFLTGIGVAATMVGAGCIGDDDAAEIEPISLDGERACDQCGMVIEDHPGPVGQLHFTDDDPEGGRPGQFCSATCMYTYRFDAADAGREVVIAFLTDYSRVDYDTFTEGDDTLFSSHVEADGFAPLSDLTVIARSDVVGAMGPELIPFSDDDDVAAAIDTYGGEALAATDVDRATIEAM